MKHLLISSLLLTSISAQAGSFACQETYDSKLAKIEKNAKLRKVVKVGASAVVGLSGGVVLAASTGALLPLGIAVYGTFFGTGLSMPVYWGVDSLDREYGLRLAYETQEIMTISYAEVIKTIEAEREETIVKLIKEFEARISHSEYLNRLVYQTNQERLQIGLPYLSVEEVVKAAKEKIAHEVRGTKIEVVNGITESLKKAKKKGAVDQSLDYDSWRQILIENQGEFCGKGKALTLNQATRAIIKKLQ